MSNSFATPASQTPLSMRFSRQEYWSGLPFSSTRDLPDTGTEPTSPALAGRFFTTEQEGSLSTWLVLSKTQPLSPNGASLDKNTTTPQWCMLLLVKRSCSEWPPPGNGRRHRKPVHGFPQTHPDVSFPLTGPVSHPHAVTIVNLSSEYNHMLSTVSPCVGDDSKLVIDNAA